MKPVKDIPASFVERYFRLMPVHEKMLTADELGVWLAVLNDARLILGVRLAVTEETVPSDFRDDDTAMASYALYAFLSYLVEEIVEALSGEALQGVGLG